MLQFKNLKKRCKVERFISSRPWLISFKVSLSKHFLWKRWFCSFRKTISHEPFIFFSKLKRYFENKSSYFKEEQTKHSYIFFCKKWCLQICVRFGNGGPLTSNPFWNYKHKPRTFRVIQYVDTAKNKVKLCFLLTEKFLNNFSPSNGGFEFIVIWKWSFGWILEIH